MSVIRLTNEQINPEMNESSISGYYLLVPRVKATKLTFFFVLLSCTFKIFLKSQYLQESSTAFIDILLDKYLHNSCLLVILCYGFNIVRINLTVIFIFIF